jgi:hypothetical protein
MRASPVSSALFAPRSEDRRAPPRLIASYLPRHRATRRRYRLNPRLPTLTSLSRHRHCGSPACDRWSAPGTVQADLLMTPNRRRPVELLGPLPPAAPAGGAALQPPVENQQTREVTIPSSPPAPSRRTVEPDIIVHGWSPFDAWARLPVVSPYFHPIGEQPPASMSMTGSGRPAPAITPCIRPAAGALHSQVRCGASG